MSRFQARYALLDPEEVAIFSRQIENADHLLNEIKSRSEQSQIKIYDATLEWISWKEKLAGSKVASQQKQLWTETLQSRSSIQHTSSSLNLDLVPVTPPHEGHRSHRTYATARSIEHQSSEFVFGLRLTLHDLDSPLAGYSMDQETTMGDFQGVLHRNKKNKLILDWERFTWVSITSVPNFNALNPTPAWTLTAQSERMWGYGTDSWLTHKLEGGAGIATGHSCWRAWVIPVLIIGHLLPKDDLGVHGGVGLRTGLAFDITSSQRWMTHGNINHWSSIKQKKTLYELKASYSYIRAQADEYRLTLAAKKSEHHSPVHAGELTWMHYL
jgi:hypothetical protein